MKNESESRLSTEVVYNKPTAPVVHTYGQLVAHLVRQMEFDVIVPAKLSMFTDDKVTNLKNQINFYKIKYAKGMDDLKAFDSLMTLSRSISSFTELMQKLNFTFLANMKEAEATINREISRKIVAIEIFTGQIKLEENVLHVLWECFRPKIYLRTLVDIFSRFIQMIHILELLILSAFKCTFQIQLTITYNSNCLEQELTSEFKYQLNLVTLSIIFLKV